MRICVLTTSFPTEERGYHGFFIFEQAIQLARRGFQIEVVAPNSSYPAKSIDEKNLHISRFNYFIPHRLQRVAYGSGIVNNLKKSLLAKLQLPFFLLFYFIQSFKSARQCDILHAHWLPSGLIAVICGKLLKKPSIVTIHGSDLNSFSKSLVFKKICVVIFKRINRIIVVSESLKHAVEGLGADPGKVLIIPNGIPDAEVFLSLPVKKQCDYRLLWVGRLIPEKNVEMLLNCFIKIKKSFPKSSLVLIGDGTERSRLQKFAGQHGIAGSVVFSGFRKRDELPEYYKDADIFVLPSKNEGFGVVALEAMASAKPIIASDVGGLREIIKNGHDGLLVSPSDSDGFVEKISQLFNNEDYRRRLSENARKSAVERYSWDNITRKLTTLYTQCLANKHNSYT
ncbi:MAG: glycosyltransferase family 4 protein [Patescibacteria group bacterium]|jgi:glycosyltransferase involved in cell wall biosynthesis